MSSRVRQLALSGLDGPGALEAATALLADRSVIDLRWLLVVDDTPLLLDHTAAYQALLTSGRLSQLLCVAIGMPSGGRRQIPLPGSISSGQGSAVLWVSDPVGVDWELAASAIARNRPPGSRTGLRDLLDILSSDVAYERVRDLVLELPGGVASPGLRLGGAGDADDSFPAALAVAMKQLTAASAAPERGKAPPILTLGEGHLRPARLREDSKLSMMRQACASRAGQAAHEVASQTRSRAILGDTAHSEAARREFIAAGEELGRLRSEVTRLLERAHAPSGLTGQQRSLLTDAGVQLPGVVADGPPADDVTGTATAAEQVARAVKKAATSRIRAGDPLPEVVSRLAALERLLTPHGSRSYLPEVDRRCPQALAERLAQPPPLPSLRWRLLLSVTAAAAVAVAAGIAGSLVSGIAWAGLIALGLVLLLTVGAAVSAWRSRLVAWSDALSPGQAAAAAKGLTDLVNEVAAREWSADAAMLEAVARTRIIVQGADDELRAYAGSVDVDGRGAQAAGASAAGAPGSRSPASGAPAARVTRLSRILAPTLRELPVCVLERQPSPDAEGGQEAYNNAKARTRELIYAWTQTVGELGALARPAFATAAGQEPGISDEELAEARTATSYDLRGAMCQLCAPTELTMLDTVTSPAVLALAPQNAHRGLAHALPPGAAWGSAGQWTGLVRLVPLRAGIVRVIWPSERQAGAGT